MSFADRIREYHKSHECRHERCQCRCGCTSDAGCIVDEQPPYLCGVCAVRWIRDDAEHGPNNEGAANHAE